MRLPNAENAIVDDSKISEYLLCEAHEDGRGKAQFLMQFGFSVLEPEVLRQALLNLARNADAALGPPSPHSAKYIVEGRLRAPDGREPVVRTVWMIDTGKTRPRLITAFAGKRPSR
ncbi:MAG: DUF6883 domain-containing protein [Hyphomicrobium sp.]